MTRGLRVATMVAALLALAHPARAQDGDQEVWLQGFYWGVPDAREGTHWWKVLDEKAPELAKAGFTHIWEPPPWMPGYEKDANGNWKDWIEEGVGYLPYDHFDFGSTANPTRYGTAEELQALNDHLNALGISPVLDSVLNHMGGGASEGVIDGWTGKELPTLYRYPHGVFEKTKLDFHPSPEHGDQEDPHHKSVWGADLCQDHPWIDLGLREAYDYAIRRFGYGGLRIDAMPFLDPGFLHRFLDHGAMKGLPTVGEAFWHWGNVELDRFLQGEDVAGIRVFDFQQAFKLGEAARDPGFHMGSMDGFGVAAENPARAMTFVNNHDLDREHGAVPLGRTMMTYSYILTMEGTPMVFWKDYFDKGLKDQLDTLLAIRRTYAAGKTRTLFAGDDMFIAERTGNGRAPGLILVTNNGTEWRSAWVTARSDWAGKTLVDRTGNAGLGAKPTVALDGRVELWAPPGGYAIFVPEDAGPPLPAKTLPPRAKGTGEATRTDGNEVFKVPDDGLPLPSKATTLSPAEIAKIQPRGTAAAPSQTTGIDGLLQDRMATATESAAAER
ncbi:MAG TPA: alpha-amylase domain-containing protein [Planctomycetota bacterium]|nr:alpha-amylase domain-containing protein [Planctomycetota bacterium]